MVTETFQVAVLRYRARGGRLYRLAAEHDISPSLLSATLSGARRCSWDPRLIAIAETLGIDPSQVFVDEDAEVTTA